MRSASSSSSMATKPPTTSLWPPRYLVAECTTTSAPRASGCCRAGVAKVLSTTTSAPRSWASAPTASMSTMRSHGLLGVSTHTMRVAGVHAARDGVEIGEVDGVDDEAGRGVHLDGEADGAAVGVVGQEHVVARRRAGAAARPRRPARRRRRSRGRRPRARRGGSRARCGWGCRCGCTRSRGACRPPPAGRSWPARSAARPRRSPGRAGRRRARPWCRSPCPRGRPSGRPPVDEARRARRSGVMTPTGWPPSSTSAADAASSRSMATSTGSPMPTVGQRRAHHVAHGPVEGAGVGHRRPGAARARTPRRSPRPAPPAARASPPASGSPRTRAGSRWPCARSRRGGCARATGATGRGSRSRSPTVGPGGAQEAVVGHPAVVVELRQVAAAGVGDVHDDRRRRAAGPRRPAGRRRSRCRPSRR